MSLETTKVGQAVAYRGGQKPDLPALVSALNTDDGGKVVSVDLTVFDGGSIIYVPNVDYSTSKYSSFRGTDEDFTEPDATEDSGNGTVTPATPGAQGDGGQPVTGGE